MKSHLPVITLCSLLLAGVPAAAQGSAGHSASAIAAAKRTMLSPALFEGLTLTQAEISRLYDAREPLLQEAKAIAKLVVPGQPPAPSVMQRLASFRERHIAQVRAGLTPPQQTRFDANLRQFHRTFEGRQSPVWPATR